jgi:aminoglycoside phosphotransferase (APT) family kinase protein
MSGRPTTTDAPLPRIERPGALAETRLLLASRLARSARMRRDRAAVLRHARTALAAIGEVDACRPAPGAWNGLFSCLASIDGRRCFVKAVPAWGRELRFWQAWARGAIAVEGRHYRLLPPFRIVQGRAVALLAFPELTGLETTPRGKLAAYRSGILEVARAVAEFNAAHPVPPCAAPPLPLCRKAERVRVPARRAVAAALGVGADRAAEIVASLGEVESRWERVSARVAAGPTSIAHMDLGAGNVVLGHGKCLLLDFGHAGVAPVGADLHVALRFRDPGGPDAAAIVAAYAEGLAELGAALDPTAIRLAAEAHFAARYRNLKFASARHPASFESALAAAERLVAAEGR